MLMLCREKCKHSCTFETGELESAPEGYGSGSMPWGASSGLDPSWKAVAGQPLPFLRCAPPRWVSGKESNEPSCLVSRGASGEVQGQNTQQLRAAREPLHPCGLTRPDPPRHCQLVVSGDCKQATVMSPPSVVRTLSSAACPRRGRYVGAGPARLRGAPHIP